MAKFCTNCGASLGDATKFCNKCGAKQDDAPPVQQAQPQYQQQQTYQQPYAPTRKKSKLPIILVIVGVVMVAVIVGVVLLINSVLGILSNTAKADYYEMGKDRIPSVKYVLGEERKVTGVNTSANGKATSREIIYGVPGSERRDELYQYYRYLVESDGFYNLTDIDFNSENSGVVVVGRNSVESGYEIQMQLKYDTDGYTLTILKQPGGITPYENENGTENSDPVGNNQTPEPNNSGASGAGNNQTPDPNNNKTPGNGSLTKDIFDIMNGGTYHIKMRVLSGWDESVMEIYAKNGMTSMLMNVEDTDMRVVVKDGKSYIVMDDYEMVIVQDADSDGDTEYFGDTENMTYIGEGSGEFYGSIYSYDEYRDNDGLQYFYYVDGGELKGIRTVSDGDTVDVVILALDKTVPDYVFDIPSDYEILEY
ncbi:MAG: zinc ribbon domain-containing protein [Oscillospiraceae bacterium]|nr:zinc ribbon domain-containing protein [Oscillospiraceae bacterium]